MPYNQVGATWLPSPPKGETSDYNQHMNPPRLRRSRSKRVVKSPALGPTCVQIQVVPSPGVLAWVSSSSTCLLKEPLQASVSSFEKWAYYSYYHSGSIYTVSFCKMPSSNKRSIRLEWHNTVVIPHSILKSILYECFTEEETEAEWG